MSAAVDGSDRPYPGLTAPAARGISPPFTIGSVRLWPSRAETEMRRFGQIAGLMLAVGLPSGCVERRFVITSDPPGALVLHNGRPVGASPADDPFLYYGNHHFTVIKDGYATLQQDVCVHTPWYQYVPIDFVSEALVPWHIEDVRRYHFTLQPLPGVNTNALLQQGEALRNEGRAIGAPVPQPALVAPAPTAVTPPTGPSPPA